eukprot:scaffold54116_cov57-Phaeocystis_antarctica.AAC.1
MASTRSSLGGTASPRHRRRRGFSHGVWGRVCAWWCVHCMWAFSIGGCSADVARPPRGPSTHVIPLDKLLPRGPTIESACRADSVARTTRARPSQLMFRKAAASAAAAAAFAACSAAAAACDAVKKPPATPPPAAAAAAAKKPAEPKSMAELQLGLATKQRRVFVTAGIDDESAKVVIEQLTHG